MRESATDLDFQLVPLEAIVSSDAAAMAGRRFNPWLLAAMLVHTAVLAAFISSKPRQIGDANGLDGAISVSLVSEADLRGDATIADRAAGSVPPPPPVPQQQEPSPVAPEPPQPQERAEPQEQQPPPVSEAAKAEPAQPEPKPESEPAKPDEPKPEAMLRPMVSPEPLTEAPGEKNEDSKPAPLEDKKPPAAEKEKPVPKPREAKPAPAKPKETKTAKLDLAIPQPSLNAPTGSRGAGIERPAGITRSGENDAFARNVIRALQQTMPQLRDTHGRVRVRITLNKNGNLVSTQVLMPSNVAGLDQSVVFATKQTYFPLPPNNATPADLVFVVTYIYR